MLIGIANGVLSQRKDSVRIASSMSSREQSSMQTSNRCGMERRSQTTASTSRGVATVARRCEQ